MVINFNAFLSLCCGKILHKPSLRHKRKGITLKSVIYCIIIQTDLAIIYDKVLYLSNCNYIKGKSALAANFVSSVKRDSTIKK